MKKKIAALGFYTLLIIAVAGLSFMPPQGNRDKNEQGQGKGNQGDKGNKGNQGNSY